MSWNEWGESAMLLDLKLITTLYDHWMKFKAQVCDYRLQLFRPDFIGSGNFLLAPLQVFFRDTRSLASIFQKACWLFRLHVTLFLFLEIETHLIVLKLKEGRIYSNKKASAFWKRCNESVISLGYRWPSPYCRFTMKTKFAHAIQKLTYDICSSGPQLRYNLERKNVHAT